MLDLQNILEKYMDADLNQIIISGARGKTGASKVRIRPIMLRDNLAFQFTETHGAQEKHSNYEKADAIIEIETYLETQFKQMQMEAKEIAASVLVSKKGKMTIRVMEQKKDIKPRNLEHNRQKRYILNPTQKVAFLMDLGVMSHDGKIVKSRYDKFRQINRFLEFIEDVLDRLPKDREITIVDFGCGKSYLTFAMYHYLRTLQGLDVRIIGLDLKAEVIAKCNQLARKYKYEKLGFIQGDIDSYEGLESVDMVVSLHACDTATDLSLAKAVKWNAQVILAVPCCQHELNEQIKSDTLAPVLSYGIIKERIASLVTDSLRANLLEQVGYETQILEFVEMEHTPKNLLIRAIKTSKKSNKIKQINECMDFLHVNPTLKELLEQQER